MDLNILFNYPSRILNLLRFNSLFDWDGIVIINNKIISLIMSNFLITDEEMDLLIFPDSLKKLDLSFNNFTHKCIDNLILPETLEELYINNNNIGNIGIKNLRLPYGLKKLSISKCNFDSSCLKDIILPPNLLMLQIDNRYINIHNIFQLRIPYKLNYIHNIYFDTKLTSESIMKYKNSLANIINYSPVREKYEFVRCKPIWFELCLCLKYGYSNNSIFLFINSIDGNKNIIKNIITFFNPFI